MPIYEYECRKCKARSELLQRLNDKPPTKCSKCGGRLEKITSAPAIQFKGSGWYVTDYGGKNGKKEKKDSDKNEKGEKGESAGTTSSEKSDTKETSPSKTSSSGSATKPKSD
ncbi:MAG TPA: FmdB family zinc ribbon protein [Pyrinomonadaceae bacterium]|jgi:putative FmdB family regulatory protein|nr:FmdB family zinc ribbon protein [Pyrinomonadaceae bacterium]